LALIIGIVSGRNIVLQSISDILLSN